MPLELLETVTPTEDESRQAEESARRLAAHLSTRSGLRLQIVEDDYPKETLAIPASAVRLLAGILAEMAQGNAVTLSGRAARLARTPRRSARRTDRVT